MGTGELKCFAADQAPAVIADSVPIHRGWVSIDVAEEQAVCDSHDRPSRMKIVMQACAEDSVRSIRANRAPDGHDVRILKQSVGRFVNKYLLGVTQIFDQLVLQKNKPATHLLQKLVRIALLVFDKGMHPKVSPIVEDILSNFIHAKES